VSDAVAPVASHERNDALDALRGFALLGVLLVNLLTAFRISLFEQFLRHETDTLARFFSLYVESKAFICFSLMFGVGLAVQEERARARGRSFAPYAARRLGALLVLGLVHLFLIWNGDILTLYAIAGACAAPFMHLRPRFLLAIAAAIFAFHALPLPYPPSFESTEAMRAHVEDANAIYSTGSFANVLAFRIQEVKPISALLLWSFPRTLALVFLGAWSWRVGLFAEKHRARVLFALVAIVLGAVLVRTVSDDPSALGSTLTPVSRAAPIILALGYAAAFVSLHGWAPRAVSWLQPIGRMALTSYLTQSIVWGFVFYGYGLGYFGRLEMLPVLGLGLLLFGAQTVFSMLWLRRHRFGPIERAWRSVTYGARQ
jgi:uncharacterized protein